MSRRVRTSVAALFALSLAFQTPSLSAATRDRDAFSPGFVGKVIRTVKKVLRPLSSPVVQEDQAPYPGPPKP